MGDLLTLVWPWAVGHSGVSYWGGLPSTEYPRYAGILVIAACIASWRGRRAGAGAAWVLVGAACFALIVSLMAEGDHAGILEALQAVADGGRDFKMLFRDLLNFIRNLLLLAGGANESMVSATPEDLVTIRDVAQRFSYSELLRIANLLIRDDDTINKAEHQRLAVEITLLKAATFPRLRAVEEVLSGGGQAPPPVRPSPKEPKRTGEAPVFHGNLSTVVERVKKSKPMLAAVLAQATAANKEGNEITWTFADQFSADSITEAREAIEKIATEVFGEKTAVKAIVPSESAQNRRAEDKPSALRDDPVLRAFQKHLGADVVDSKLDSRRSK